MEVNKRPPSEPTPPPSSDHNTIRIEQERLHRIIAAALTKRPSTTRLTDEERRRIPIIWRKAGIEGIDAEQFIRLPRGIDSSIIPRWLIQILPPDPGATPVGIEVVSDIVLGI